MKNEQPQNPAVRPLDAGDLREAFSRKLKRGHDQGLFLCWGEAWQLYSAEAHALAEVAQLPVAYVFACAIDDVEGGVVEEDTQPE
jgi:hypothetical protein